MALIDAGVTLIRYEDALVPGKKGKIREGIVVLVAGEPEDGDMAMGHVSSLYNNPILGVFDRPCPVNPDSSVQEKLDAVVKVLAWDLVHLAVFLEGDHWTLCTMNGAVVEFNINALLQDVMHALIPKLTAQVVPPRKTDITYRYGALDTSTPEHLAAAEDFLSGGKVWAKNENMMSHTSAEVVQYRNDFYRRLAQMYLDNRTGMSYGFFARQLPLNIQPAYRLADLNSAFEAHDWEAAPVHEVEGTLYVHLSVNDTPYLAEVPDVWVLSTRSGCSKTNPDPHRDLVRMGLVGGKVVLETPNGIDTAADCKPSYDTITIMAHALGNALVASVLKALNPNDAFALQLGTQGLTLSHWHGYPNASDLPTGYYMHGAENPSVSCSTTQSAVYSLLGKFEALAQSLATNQPYLGDVHIEPHHGTNMVGCLSLTEVATWNLAQHIHLDEQ